MTKTSFCLAHSERPVRFYAPFDFLLCPPHCPPPGPYKNHFSWMSAAATATGDKCGTKGP